MLLRYVILCHVLFCLDDFERKCDPLYAPNGQSAFSDAYPFLLASEESLIDLNTKIPIPATMTNFRPNIVLKGLTKPWAEDTWKKIIFKSKEKTLGEIEMNVCKPCSRCKVPSIDPNTGVFHPRNEPTRTMKGFRSGKALGFESSNKKERWDEEASI